MSKHSVNDFGISKSIVKNTEEEDWHQYVISEV